MSQASDQPNAVPEAERLAGIALGTLGRYRAAEQTLRVVSPAVDPFAALALGNVLDEQGQRAVAREIWRPLGRRPRPQLSALPSGTAMTSRNRRERAEEMLVLATRIDPSNAAALHALGGYYWSTDQTKGAEMYRQALAVGGLAPFFERIATGRVALVDGRLEDAATAPEDAVSIQPQHAEANQLLGTVLNRLGRLSEAIAAFQRATDAYSTHSGP